MFAYASCSSVDSSCISNSPGEDKKQAGKMPYLAEGVGIIHDIAASCARQLIRCTVD